MTNLSAIECALTDDTSELALRLAGSATVLFLEAAEVDLLINLLGNHRTRMREAVAERLPAQTGPTALYESVVDPILRVEPEVVLGGVLLHVRDPRFGWLHYVLERSRAAELAGALQKSANLPLNDERKQ
jgi:hypothetical protein